MMAFILIALAFATGVNSSQCSSTCCFGLTASGGQTGTVCQLDDGQTRIGGGLAPAEFCINGTTIEDSAGRGCIITRWSLNPKHNGSDSGAAPFTIGCNGVLSYKDSSTFWECQTGDNGEANIYTTPGGTVCNTITLTADNCMPYCGS